MALRKILAKRYGFSSPAVTLERSPLTSYPSVGTLAPPNAPKTNFQRDYLTAPDSAGEGFFRRFLHRKSVNSSPEFLSVPVGEKLREALKGINVTGDRLRLDGLTPPVREPAEDDRNPNPLGISIQDARKLLRAAQVEKLKERLREIPRSCISYPEFVRICVGESGNEDQGSEFAKMLDESGSVIVLGNIVFLRPEQVAKSMENIISQSMAIAMATPNDPRRKQLEILEHQKSIIDQKARALVRGELYCGLGFIVAQTLAFMRLTFWELSWDVMEPICFFVTSLHFAIGYGFFLRTSTEPTFEGYFRRRFEAKQDKLIKAHNFDIDKYNELRKAFYPNLTKSYDPFSLGDREALSAIRH